MTVYVCTGALPCRFDPTQTDPCPPTCACATVTRLPLMMLEDAPSICLGAGDADGGEMESSSGRRSNYAAFLVLDGGHLREDLIVEA